MIIAVAVVKNVAQNLGERSTMADIKGNGKKINNQTCLQEDNMEVF